MSLPNPPQSTGNRPANNRPVEPLIVWTPELSVGIQEIDEQHKTLVDILNQLHVAIMQHHASAEVVHILDELVEYTRIHFAVEESLMRVLDYPDYEAHHAEHEKLIAQVQQFRHRVIDDGRAITFELLHFLKQWLTVHIMESDQRYTEHFIQRGVRASYEKPSWLSRLWGRR